MKRHMKITYSILGLTAGAVLLLASGCSKQDQPSRETSTATPPVASDMQKAAEAPKSAPAAAAAATDAGQAVSAAASDAQKAVEAPKAAVEPMPPAPASQTDAAAAAVPSAMNTQIEGLIYNAKGLVTNQKYQDALNVIQQLSSMKLTPEQQTLVDGLKAQIQTALAKSTATGAASALGNALGGKK